MPGAGAFKPRMKVAGVRYCVPLLYVGGTGLASPPGRNPFRAKLKYAGPPAESTVIDTRAGCGVGCPAGAASAMLAGVTTGWAPVLVTKSVTAIFADP